jgi:hypothetical protein
MYSLRVNLGSPYQPDLDHRLSSTYTIAADIPVDEASRRNSGDLQLLREALELFTALFKVNYSKFGEILGQNVPPKASSCPLVWTLWPVGVVPSQNKESLTWGYLLGYTDDLWPHSLEFLSAMHKLEMMEGKQAAGMSDALVSMELSWTCVFPASEISGFHQCGKEKDSLRLFSHQLREVLSIPVPCIARLCVERQFVADTRYPTRPQLEEKASLDDRSTSTPAQCQYLLAKDVNLAEASDLTEMAAALASTATETFILWLADFVAEEDAPRAVINGGLLLNVLLRGRLQCYVAGHDLRHPIASVSVRECDVLCKWVSDGVIAAVCSAVAELPPDTAMDVLSFYSICRGRWLWIVWMLCCGSSLLNLHDLTLVDTSLTRADIAAISMVVTTRYPVVEPDTSSTGDPVYGVASIPAGAELQPARVARGDNTVLIAATAFRCRARSFPDSTPDWVEVVVPGYGICKTKAGDGGSCRFDRDSFELDNVTQPYRECRLQSLVLHISRIELDTLVLELVRYVGGGLRSLSMQLGKTNPHQAYDPNHRAS